MTGYIKLTLTDGTEIVMGWRKAEAWGNDKFLSKKIKSAKWVM